ncbi:MAG TPA: helix-turn-helix transcriptional regulator [Gemmatimonadaceae bacterium]|nr:helix-turn-helix transcriptional regulator [Gemmatimonadaceae bacterium]
MPRHAARDPRDELPVKPVDFLLLLALARGERHGYGLMQDVERDSAGSVRLEAGNLYRSLRRLLERELCEESERRPAPDLDDERRRYYRLTPFGRRVLAAEALRLRSLVRAAEAARLIDPEPAA